MHRSACRILLLALLSAALPSMAIDLARDGRALVRIAVPAAPVRLEKMALSDLQEFLGKMTGARFEAVAETELPAGEPAIYLGWTRFAQAQGIDAAKLGKEEWVVRTVGDSLVITGGRPAGTFYAVWKFLNGLGCYAMAMDCYSAPPRRSLSVPGLSVQGRPPFAGRLIYNDFPGAAMAGGMPADLQEQYRLFALRSGTNGEQTHRQKQYYYGDLFNISTVPFHHTLTLYVPPKKYFATHPEYFAMNAQGQRFAPQGFAKGSLCMSNREVWKVTLESLRSFIRRDRAERAKEDWPVLYDISLLDNSPYICKCPACTAISKEEGSECGLLLRYINYVATEIAKEYPEIIIRTFAYSAARKPPKKTRPAANVLLQVCDEFPQADAFRPLTHPLNAHNLASLKEWAATGARIQFYDYWNISGVYFDPPRWETVLDALQPDLRLFKELGAVGLFVEFERDHVSPQPFYDLAYFVASQLMMDLDVDVEALVDAFLPAYYGAAAPVMKMLLAEMREGVRKQPTKMAIHIGGAWRYFTPENALRYYHLLKAAAASLPAGGVHRQRVESELLTLCWAVLARQVTFGPVFRAGGVSMDQLVAECEAYARQHIMRIKPANAKFFLDRFHQKFDKIKAVLPRPAKFKGVADESFRLLAFPQASPIPNIHSEVVDDADSITGKAIVSHGPSKTANDHGVGKMIQATPTIRVPNLKFVLGNIGPKHDIKPGTQWEISTVLRKVHQDEKYHWYKLRGAVDLQEKSYFWGHAWAIQFKTNSVYVLTDGVADNNVWEAWFSAKFTGPAYVPGSTRPDAIYVDMVALVRPGAAGVAPDDDALSQAEPTVVKPPEFASVPDGAIRVFDVRAARPIPKLCTEVVADRDSATGKALRTYGPAGAKHGFNVRVPGQQPSTKFCIGGANGDSMLILQGLEDNFENYHWFRMKKPVQITAKSYFWGFNWALQFHPRGLYDPKGTAEDNTWEVWFSVKFTGPAYVPGSTQKDAVWIDRLVFVKPGLMK